MATSLQLVITLGHERRKITALIATAALRGPLCIIAGSAWIPSYGVAHTVRESTTEVESTLSRIRLARAFSFYQLLDVLAETRGDGTPILILDFLHNFLNNEISMPVRVRTLRACCDHLRRLSVDQPVTVFTPRAANKEYELFYSMIAAIADEVIQAKVEEEIAWQPRLL